jgi:hypothetical protein
MVAPALTLDDVFAPLIPLDRGKLALEDPGLAHQTPEVSLIAVVL